MTHSFQVDTDKLQAVIDCFNAQAFQMSAIVAQLEQHRAALIESGGDDAARAVAQLDGDVLPRVIKLRDGLGASGAALADFLAKMIEIQPALDHLHAGMPKITAARDKIAAHIDRIQNQDPDELKRAFQRFLREQGHQDAADQLDQLLP
jgi:hypothetical protein